MVNILIKSNPFDVNEVEYEGCVEQGLTIRETLKQVYPDFVEFNLPTICQLNGNYILRTEWDSCVLKDNDVLVFTAILQDAVTAGYAALVIALASAVYSYANMPKPVNSDIPGADPVYSIQGHRNQNKLGQPIEVCYGRNFIYPSIASNSYTVFKNNDEFLFSLFSLGEGDFDIHGVYIDDTPIENFEDAELEFYSPNELVTLFPDNVETSIEVSEIELFATNEGENTGYVGPFTANAPNTRLNRIEVDIGLPQGLYLANNSGGLDELTVEVVFEYRLINDDSIPIGEWTQFVNFTKTLKTTTPQRYTEGLDVPSGRYEVRARRINDKNLSFNAGDIAVWQRLRLFYPSVRDYNSVTTLAIKLKATNNLNSTSQTSVKVDATRKLPTYNILNGTWSEPVATRSAVWALCDVFRSEYGAKLSDEFLELVSLTSTNDSLNSRGDTFDWIFDKRTTIWEAAKKICRAVRAVPRLPGSRLTMVRDTPQTIPKQMFTMDNIVANSFNWDVQFFEINEKDSIIVEYNDINTGAIETVLCTLPGGTSNNPEEIRIEGINNRAQAYREGMYILASNFYLREGCSFRTGLEGHIPNYGDIVSVSYDIPFWGSSGFVKSVTNLYDGSYNVELEDPVDFKNSNNFYIAFRKLNGSTSGPFLCTEIDEYNVNIITNQAPVVVQQGYEPPMFQFGEGDSWSKICRITDITPSNNEQIQIKTVVYKPEIHSFDGLPTPDYEHEGATIVIPALPQVTGLRVNNVVGNDNQVQIVWTPALGAKYYIIESSSNNQDWVSRGTTTSTVITLDVVSEMLYIRVAAVNSGKGPWSIWSGEVGSAKEKPVNISGLTLLNPFVGRQFTVVWDQLLNADYYIVEVETTEATPTILRTISVTSLDFTYTSDDAQSDGASVRKFRVKVKGVNVVGESEEFTSLVVNNPIPVKTVNVQAALFDKNRYEAIYDMTWDANPDPDTDGYYVFSSNTNGFTPDLSKPSHTVLTNYLKLEVPMLGEWEPGQGEQGTPYNYTFDTYYRVAAFDPWTNELILSDQLHIPEETFEIT